MTLESRLLGIGLSDKEAAVYMAMLYLGPSTAQDIAIRAKVNRATTYVMIESLMERGLTSEVTKNKKTLFQSEDPIEILRVLESSKAEMEEKMGQARLVIPELQELYNLNRSKISVRLLEGKESMRIIQNDLARCKSRSFDNVTNITASLKKTPPSDKDHRRVYYELEFKARSIFTYDPKQSVPHLPFLKNEERRMISQEKFPVNGEILLYDKKMAIINYVDKYFGIIIEDELIFQTYTSLFNLAWEAAEKYSVKDRN